MELWFVLSIIFVLLMSSFSFLTKRLLNQQYDPILYGAIMQFCTGVIGFIIALFNGFHFTVTPVTLLSLFFAGTAYTIGPALYYTGLQNVDLSKTVILESSGVFWALIMGLLVLGENLTITKIFAALFIFIGIIIIGSKKKMELNFSKFDIFILASSIFYAFGSAIDKFLVGYSDPVSYVTVSFLTAGISMFAVFNRRLREKGKDLLTNANFVKTIIINSSIVAVSYRLLFMAYDFGGQASKVHAITLTQAVVVALLGILFLKERSNLLKKITAIALSIIGLFLMNY